MMFHEKHVIKIYYMNFHLWTTITFEEMKNSFHLNTCGNIIIVQILFLMIPKGNIGEKTFLSFRKISQNT